MQIGRDSRSFYERIGGEIGVRRLVRRFYAIMDTMPEAAGIRALHADMARAQDRLFMFLSGWMGGPALYTEKFGHPRLRMRHLPFTIGDSERDQWMACMSQALDETVTDEALRDELKDAFTKIADFMRNQP